MSRYLLSALLGLIALFTLYGIGNSREAVQTLNRGTRAARTNLSATPVAAANGASSLSQAGQYVKRQTSVEGLQQARDNRPAQSQSTTATSAPPTSQTDTSRQAQTTNAGQVQRPASGTAGSQDAIPALW